MTNRPGNPLFATTGLPSGPGAPPAPDAGGAAATPSTPISRFIANVSSMSIGISLLLHTLVTLVIAVATVSLVRSENGGGASPIELDVSLTSPTALSGEVFSPVTAVTPSADALVDEVATPGVLDGPGGVDAPGEGPGLGEIADGLGGAGGGDIGQGLGVGGAAGGGGARFFGVEARGSRFLYICDISGSMNYDARGTPNGKKLGTLKIELMESIKGLADSQSFYVVFFSSDAQPMQDSRKWMLATPVGKKFAADKISALAGFGGTEPWPAFEIALAMRPAPDAIYFMTDGEFDISVAEQVRQVNGRTASGAASRRVPIHCISLVSREGEEVLRKIAAESGGTYLHVEGTR